MNNKKLSWIFFGIFLFVILSNVFLPVRWVVALVLPKEEQKSITGIWIYTTEHKEFERGQDGLFIMSNSYSRVLTGFRDYKHCYPTSPDTILYRTYKLEPWQFWNWINYYTDPRWKYPYLNPADVKPKLRPSPPCTCSNYNPGPTNY